MGTLGMSGPKFATARGARPLVVLLVLGILVAGCGGLRSGLRPSLRPGSTSQPLRVVQVPASALPWPGYDTSVSYPQVSSGNSPLVAVNAAVREAIARDEQDALPDGPHPPDPIGRGGYTVSVDQSLMSACTLVFSVRLPASFHNPEGHDFAVYWITLTVEVPSGRRVSITDLLANSDKGLVAIA